MATIFISYSRKDKRVLNKLVKQIHNVYGAASFWYDQAIPGGDDWWAKISEEIKQCQFFIFLMSDTAVTSKYCQRELKLAIDHNKYVLPVLLRTYGHEYPNTLPDDLTSYMRTVQYIDVRKGYTNFSMLWGAINRIQNQSLSHTERWLLYNQFEILDLLNRSRSNPDNAEIYDSNKTIISMGYEWNYDDISSHILPSMGYRGNEEVIDILDMFRAINTACRDNCDCSDLNQRFLRFQGFDGNNENNHYGFAKYIIDTEGRFGESAPPDKSGYNSHMPMLPKYRNMLQQWKNCDITYLLTKDDVIRIISA